MANYCVAREVVNEEGEVMRLVIIKDGLKDTKEAHRWIKNNPSVESGIYLTLAITGKSEICVEEQTIVTERSWESYSGTKNSD